MGRKRELERQTGGRFTSAEKEYDTKDEAKKGGGRRPTLAIVARGLWYESRQVIGQGYFCRAYAPKEDE